MLTQLQARRLLTAPQLAAKFNVSVRTIYRDIRTLERAGVPIVTEEGKGYSVTAGYRLPPVMFTEAEANALVTAEKLVLLTADASFRKSYAEAVTKIKAVLGSEAQDKVTLLAGRVAFEVEAPQTGVSTFLSTIQWALTNGKIIHLDYVSHKNELTSRAVEPFALLNRVGDNWYLVGWCRLRQDYRLFRFDRIQNLVLTAEGFAPHKMSLEEYLATYQNRPAPLT